MSRRRRTLLAAAATLAAASALLAAPTIAATPTATTAPLVAVRMGTTPDTALFPSDRFTVADSRQYSGRRVNLPMPQCTTATSSICDSIRLLDQLDGFDLQPRVTIPFTGAIDVRTVTPRTVWIQGPRGRAGIYQLVFDPATDRLEGIVDHQLAEDTTFTIVVTRGVHDTSGRPIASRVTTTFSTETATRELDHLRRSLDSGLAYRQAGITASQRGLDFTQGSLTTVFEGDTVPQEGGIKRNDQTSADPNAAKSSSVVPNLVDPGSVGYYGFGSFLSPQFVTNDAVIPQVPTTQTPRARSAARLGFTMLLPKGTPPAGGWPVAVYGPGFTRSIFDLYVTADHNATLGIATLATQPLGHGYGPDSTITVTHAPTPSHPDTSDTFLSYGRGRDRDGDGMITDDEGVQPSDHKVYQNGQLVDDIPSRNELVGLRDGLIQTTSDNMALVRAIERGVSVPTEQGPIKLSNSNVMYYGLSFGGIYGTMLLGTDPEVRVGFLNSGGGPILDIARLSGFRPLLASEIKISRPDLLNGGPGLDGFTESLPEPTDPPITTPYAGSALIRDFLADGNWLERQGSPEAFAPLIRLHPRYGSKTVEYLNAYGDHTVPNITTGNILRAGQLFDRFSYYRNDKTPTKGTDPHGFLADPTLTGREMAEDQLAAFLKSGGTNVIDPDGPGPIFEVPIANHDNTECIHYAEPQTGQTAYPPAPDGSDCPPVQH